MTVVPSAVPTGGYYVAFDELESRQDGVWNELLRSSLIAYLPMASTMVNVYVVIEALPATVVSIGTAAEMIRALERLFGESATQTARMLRVSRPMVYHYREGMEPSAENRRRLQALAMLVGELNAESNAQLRKCLKVRQPEGRTLLEFLSDEELDVPALRHVLRRNVAEADHALRRELMATFARGESDDARSDTRDERLAAGHPVYVGDSSRPGSLIRLSPDGSRIRGRMIKRKFVSDE